MVNKSKGQKVKRSKGQKVKKSKGQKKLFPKRRVTDAIVYSIVCYYKKSSTYARTLLYKIFNFLIL